MAPESEDVKEAERLTKELLGWLGRLDRRAAALERDITAFDARDPAPQLETCTELRRKCRELGVPGVWKMRKGELGGWWRCELLRHPALPPPSINKWLRAKD